MFEVVMYFVLGREFVLVVVSVEVGVESIVGSVCYVGVFVGDICEFVVMVVDDWYGFGLVKCFL